ncbi:MAG: HDIG domain-containing protein, partial [Bacteroidales bacterium]|nr:HDIG domain-containing protein [Bacteroidales bacterium]
LKDKSIYITMVIALVIMVLLYPSEGRFKYEYHKGRPWMYETLVAPMDFPILKSQAELLKEKNEAAELFVPYYVYNNDILLNVMQTADGLNRDSLISNKDLATLKGVLSEIYTAGIIKRDEQLVNNDKNNYIIVQKDKRAEEVPRASVYNIRQAVEKLQSKIAQIAADSITIAGISKIKPESLIQANLIYDQQSTELVHKNATDYISPTKGIVYTGQLIVSEGEIITAYIEQVLDSYKAEYELSMGYSGSNISLVAGHALIILAILFLVFASIYTINIQILREKKRFNFIIFLILLTYIITVVVRDAGPEYLFMVPFAVFALYMMAFFPAKVVLPIYMISLLPLLIIAENGIELYILNLFAGAVTLLSFVYLYRGWLQFLNSLLLLGAMFIVFIAFRLLESGKPVYDYIYVVYLFLNSMFIVAAYPLVFLLEKIFGLVSVSTLKDLSDTNNTLLQELARKAPGTFQHCLQVANLSERAVNAIHGNARLVKVGAMYHDIGKLVNPQCFIENQAPGIDYHKNLSPQESAQLIIKHVSDGVELAKKFKLPKIITAFITSHHGRSVTGYFYSKYCLDGGDPNNKEPFTYNGTLPTTKEQVVVMMADAVEAASRSLKDYSAESISNLVDKITAARISESQLIEADISLKEINTVKEVFKKHLKEIYHSRIEYPAANQSGNHTANTAVGTSKVAPVLSTESSTESSSENTAADKTLSKEA